jgi:membrane protein
MTLVRIPAARRSIAAGRRRVEAGRTWWANSLYGNGWRRIRELDLDTHALALCAQQVLCTAPLIVAISAVLQRVTGNGVGVVMTRFFGLHDDAADAVERLFGRSSPSISTMALLFAMLTAVVFSTSVGAVQQRAFELIWTLPRVIGVRSYLRQLFWAIALGVFSGAVLLAGALGRLINHHVLSTGPWAAVILQTVLTFLFYWWSQYWLLGGRVGWRALMPGAVAVAIGTAILVRLTRLIMPSQISWQAHAYGLIGGVFVLSVWLMILSAVIFGGVLLGALIVQRRTAVEVTASGDVEPTPLTLAGLDSEADAELDASSKSGQELRSM